MESLSSRQSEVFQALQKFIQTHGYAPTMRDLAKMLGIVNPTAIKRMLDIFEEKGLLESAPGKSRAIKLKYPSDVFSEEVFVLPMAGRIVAGMPVEAIENIEEKIPVPQFLANNDPRSFILKVKGASMEPEFHEGDLVVIQPQTSAHHGELVAAMVDGEATVKEFFKKGSEIILHPLNPDYSDIPVSSDFQLIGKVVGLLRKI